MLQGSLGGTHRDGSQTDLIFFPDIVTMLLDLRNASMENSKAGERVMKSNQKRLWPFERLCRLMALRHQRSTSSEAPGLANAEKLKLLL